MVFTIFFPTEMSVQEQFQLFRVSNFLRNKNLDNLGYKFLETEVIPSENKIKMSTKLVLKVLKSGQKEEKKSNFVFIFILFSLRIL